MDRISALKRSLSKAFFLFLIHEEKTDISKTDAWYTGASILESPDSVTEGSWHLLFKPAGGIGFDSDIIALRVLFIP